MLAFTVAWLALLALPAYYACSGLLALDRRMSASLEGVRRG